MSTVTIIGDGCDKKNSCLIGGCMDKQFREALVYRKWVEDIKGSLSVVVIVEYLHLWDLLEDWTCSMECKINIFGSYLFRVTTPTNQHIGPVSFELRQLCLALHPLCCLTCLMRPCHWRGNCTWCSSGISLAGLP